MLELQRLRAILDGKRAGDDEGHAITQRFDVMHIVGGQHDGLTRAVLGADQFANAVGVDRVKPHGRLVEEDEIGIVHDRADEVEPHHHSLRELGDPYLGGVL